MPERIISAERSVIVAADVQPHEFENLMLQIGKVAGISGYKVGFEVGLGLGLRNAVDMANESNPYTVVIYDHQKAGNDIPATGKNFARTMDRAGVDAAILFPFTGPDVEESWIGELRARDIDVIVGAEMTHPNIAGEKGYIKDDAFKRMFAQAIKLEVNDFVVPGNKPEKVQEYREFFETELGEGNFDLYAPGFVTQGGSISEAGEAAGKQFHAIVGSAIYDNKEGKDPKTASQEMVQALV